MANGESIASTVGAVLFDLDGVLVDSYQVWFHLMNATAKDLGYPSISKDRFHEAWGQGVEADRERFYPGHTVEELSAHYDAHFGDHLEHLTVASGVGDVFAALVERGLASAVITNTPNPLARDVVARAGATPDLVVGGTDVPEAKPAPDMVHHACEKLGFREAEAVVVGDSRFDRDAARAAGTAFVGLGIDGDFRIEALPELIPLLPARRSA